MTEVTQATADEAETQSIKGTRRKSNVWLWAEMDSQGRDGETECECLRERWLLGGRRKIKLTVLVGAMKANDVEES